MFDALYQLGKYSLHKTNKSIEDPIDILIEDPASTPSYKHVLGIVINSFESIFSFNTILLEEYDSSKLLKYIYRQGSPRGSDITLTTRITDIKKTFNQKILGKSIIFFSSLYIKMKIVIQQKRF